MLVQTNVLQPSTKKATEQKISLFNILTCLLCSSKAKMAHICPNCSKFYCQSCIKQWIRQGNPQCPNCKSTINETTIVNCNKLSLDLSSALQALIQLQTPQESQCQTHSITQTYYCEQCVMAICSDCIVLETKHRGHSIVKLSKMKMDFNQHILLNLSKIRKCVREMQKNREDRLQGRTNQADERKSRLETLTNHIQKLKLDYQTLINTSIQKYQFILTESKLMYKAGCKLYDECLNQVKQLPKGQLVMRSQQKADEIRMLIEQQDGQQNGGRDELVRMRDRAGVSVVRERYARQAFVLGNYTQAREKREVIYSDTFSNGHTVWRLKIYPAGLDKPPLQQIPSLKRRPSQYNIDQSISIYIEQVSEVRPSSRYQFIISITSQSDPNKSIEQVYEAEFGEIRCWGYDQFVNIGVLYQKGFVNGEDDSIKIEVSVGPPSYYYSRLDQEAVIENRLKKIGDNALRIEELRRCILQKQEMKRQAQQLALQMSQAHPNPNLVQSRLEYDPQPQTPHEQLSDIKTPRGRIIPNQACKTQCRDIQLEQSINYKNYIMEIPLEEPIRGNQEFDHQAAELRKIYRRMAQIGDKGNLLLF